MRQVCIPRYGPPEVLTIRGVAEPAIAPGTVRIAVQMIGVNFADVLARQGLYPDCPKPPVVVGYEVAGLVDAVGEGVTTLQEGQPVLALTRFGGYAEQVVVPVEQVFALPPDMPLALAAALPVNFLTAYVMLYVWGRLQPGEHVLIHGAAGGVGLAAVQLARLRQAEIYGTATATKHAFLHAHGVHHTIDYYHDLASVIHGLTGGRGVDIALDPFGGRSYAHSYKVLAPLGRLIVFGVSRLSSGPRRSLLVTLWNLLTMPWFHPLRLLQDNKAVIGVNMGRLWEQTAMMRHAMSDILHLYAQGHIQPVISQTFPWTEAAAAHRYLQERRNIGKVLLAVKS
ncbi:MAG: zinc-binding dehydrogenase [Candidatus Tectimicrobiota bacterium]